MKQLSFYSLLVISNIIHLICYNTSTAQCAFQSKVSLQNPSFEGAIGAATMAAPWQMCGGSPDTQPGVFNINLPASEGNTYLGFWRGSEGASQKLSNALQAGKSYKFEIDLAIPANAVGGAIIPGPSSVKIWGGFGPCDATELLWTSPTIADTNWMKHVVQFVPSQNYDHFFISVSANASLYTYILVDNISDIVSSNSVVDITSHQNGDVAGCVLNLSGTASLDIIDSVEIAGAFLGGNTKVLPVAGAWASNLQFTSSGSYTIYTRAYYYDSLMGQSLCAYDSVIIDVSVPNVTFSAQDHCLNNNTLCEVASGSVLDSSLSFVWDYGDGQILSGINPVHFYALHGDYIIKLTAIDEFGCESSAIKSVRVYPNPTASFSVNNACVNSLASFVSNSFVATGSIENTLWDFDGDGTIDDSSLFASKKYFIPGSYAVSLIVESNHGCKDTIRENAIIYSLPQASFTYSKACLNEAIEFISTSNAHNSEIVKTFWEINNDGTIDGNNSSINCTFSETGVYLISLMVETALGCKDTLSDIITVHANPIASFSFQNACEGEKVEFTSTSYDKKGSIKQVWWDFESDGKIDANLPNETYTYENGTNFLVTLIIESEYGCRDTLAKAVNINPLPIAKIELDNEIITQNDGGVNMFNASGNAVEWSWNVDGFVTLNTPCLVFDVLDTGFYCAILEAVSDKGCKDTTQRCFKVTPSFNFYIPNSFTPDDDKLNDLFLTKGTGVISFSMLIFNRNGEKVFETTDVNEGWDGKSISGRFYPQGVYVYNINVKDFQGEEHVYIGNVNLLR